MKIKAGDKVRVQFEDRSALARVDCLGRYDIALSMGARGYGQVKVVLHSQLTGPLCTICSVKAKRTIDGEKFCMDHA